MSKETLESIIKKAFLFAKHSCTIVFQGGEPTLCGLEFYENVIYYVEKYNRRKIPVQFSLQTNGFGITDQWCVFFNKHNFLIGLSIDGTTETHDRFRHNHQGEGTYQKVLSTSKLFDSYEVQYNILTVVTSEIANSVKAIYSEYKEKGWQYLQFIPCLNPLENTQKMEPYSLTPKAYGDFLIQLFNCWYKDWKKGKAPYIRLFDNYVSILMGHPPESCAQIGVCGIQYVIEGDGSVYPCDFYVLDELLLGNLNYNSFRDIDAKRKDLSFIQRSRNHSSKCMECNYFSVCRGECYRNRDNQGNSLFCDSYFRFFENSFHKLEEIAKFQLERRVNKNKVVHK
jgi:uncharacterized protein